MAKFNIQNLEDETEIEIIALNIDNENNILAKENGKLIIIPIADFKDMILGSFNGNDAKYKIID